MARALVLWLALAALLCPAEARAQQAGAHARPNLVLIVWDELAPVAEAAPDSARAALARAGASFPAGFAPLAHGRPAVAALLTGQYPHQSGVYYEVGPKRLEPGATLPALLAAAGYATFAAGRLRDGPPERLGFQRASEDALGAAEELARFQAESSGKPLFVLWAPERPEGSGAGELERDLAALVARFPAESTLFAFVGDEEERGQEFAARTCAEAARTTPILFSWPGTVPAGERAERVSLLDVYPTLLDYAGLAAPAGRAGRSLRGLFEGGELADVPAPAAFFEPRVSPASKAGKEPHKDLLALTLRDGSWKYELFLHDVGLRVDRAEETVTIERSAGDQALFDLARDPGESDDLFPVPEHAARLAAMRSAVLEWWRASGGAEFPLPYLPPALGAPPSVERPNIVLVVSDDQDYEHLGFMENPRVHTPTLDELARTGVVFPVAHVPMSRCRPSQAALLTGRWPQQTNVYDNETARLLSRQDSLPNLLKAAGYATFQGGKMWEGSSLSMGFLGPAVSDMAFLKFAREGQAELFRFLERTHEERPFFVWWAPTLPHVPHDPPERFRKMFAETEVPLPPGLVGDPEAFRAAERTSFAMEAWFDDELGQLCAKLKALGEFEDTLFVFLIDNGWANGFPSKGTAFEKGLRTPVVCSWPKGFAGGRRDARLLSTLDLPATILDFAGVPAPAGAQGISLRPLLTGEGQIAPRPVLYGALYRYHERPGPPRPEKDVFALYARSERWKFVLYLKDVQDPEAYHFQHDFAAFPARKRGERDLYDLEADPYERNDLAGDSSQAARMDEFLAGCLSWWKASGGGELDLP